MHEDINYVATWHFLDWFTETGGLSDESTSQESKSNINTSITFHHSQRQYILENVSTSHDCSSQQCHQLLHNIDFAFMQVST